MDENKLERRIFIKKALAIGSAATLSACAWKYRSVHASPPLFEKAGGLLAQLNDLKVNTATLVYTKKDGPIILVRLTEEVKAYKSFCHHTGCELNDGEKDQPLDIKNNEIRCFLHDSYFDIHSGERIRGPARKGTKLPDYKVQVKGGGIYKAA